MTREEAQEFATAAAGLATAADAVARLHEAQCRRVVAMMGSKERRLALASHGPENAWLWCADPAILDLKAAVIAFRAVTA